MKAREVNIDGIIGSTHNYAGLSYGNIASQKYAFSISNPKQAALQGLEKMKFLHDLGIPQIIMPAQPRPALYILSSLGYNINNAPNELLAQVYSASSMWVANAATISPSADTADGKIHITPANLVSKFHRFIEPPITASYLKRIFPEFVHHAALPAHSLYADEGAANHMRLCNSHGEAGIEIFVYGEKTNKFPARQTLQASQAIARLHQLNPQRTIFLKQNSIAIDAGVFHNDVIAMSNENILIYHEMAYDNLDEGLLSAIKAIKISDKELPLDEAVSTYFFNSQIVTIPSGKMVVIAPKECEENINARNCFKKLIEQGYIETVYYQNVRESMKNGGGPACLRLRIALRDDEFSTVNSKFILNSKLFNLLSQWINKNYRDRIAPDDLRDPLLLRESQIAMTELENILEFT